MEGYIFIVMPSIMKGGGQIIKGVLPSGDKLLKNGVVDISECLWYVPVI
jgi:hypothetical protein